MKTIIITTPINHRIDLEKARNIVMSLPIDVIDRELLLKFSKSRYLTQEEDALIREFLYDSIDIMKLIMASNESDSPIVTQCGVETRTYFEKNRNKALDVAFIAFYYISIHPVIWSAMGILNMERIILEKN